MPSSTRSQYGLQIALDNQPAPETPTANHEGACTKSMMASKAFPNIKTIFQNQYSSSYFLKTPRLSL